MEEQQSLKDSLKTILEIQEFDVKMIRLMRIKNDRKKELRQIDSLKQEVTNQKESKEREVLELKKQIKLTEGDLEVLQEKIEHNEKSQKAVKKLEEFNALSQAINQAERKKSAIEQQLNDLTEELNTKEEAIVKLVQDVEETEKRSFQIVKEIQENLAVINQEGKELQESRNALIGNVSKSVLEIYEKLLKNKKDRVVVPIENRVCQGCYISLTAQHENVVRKGERLIFCEYCSRIHYWPESEVAETTASSSKRRRRQTQNT